MGQLQDTGLNKKLVDSEVISKELVAIEEDLAALRATYDQYFMGLEKRLPSAPHDALRKRFQKLKSSFIRSTQLKFRVQSLASKLQTYERLWEKTLKEMESGTYRRDLFKARLRQQNKGKRPARAAAPEPAAAEQPAAPPSEAGADSVESAMAALVDRSAGGKPAVAAPPAAVKSAPPPPASKPGPPRPASSGPVLSDDKLRAVYDAYVTAKKRCNEDTSKLSFESMAATLRKQVPQLMQQHKATTVEFKVVIKDGKAALRAVPKE